MDRSQYPDKAFAHIQGDNRLLLHHYVESGTGDGHASVDVDMLLFSLQVLDSVKISNEEKKVTRAHLMDHFKAIANIDGNNYEIYRLEELQDQLHHFASRLSGMQETPRIYSTGEGFARYLYNSRTKELHYLVEFCELSTPETAAHFHKGFGGQSGEIIIDLPLGEIKEGVVTLTGEQEKLLFEGEMFINIHSSTYPDGEIRGHVLPVDLARAAIKDDMFINRPAGPLEGDDAPTVRKLPIAGEQGETVDSSEEPKGVEAGQEDSNPKADTTEQTQKEVGGGKAPKENPSEVPRPKDPKNIDSEETETDPTDTARPPGKDNLAIPDETAPDPKADTNEQTLSQPKTGAGAQDSEQTETAPKTSIESNKETVPMDALSSEDETGISEEVEGGAHPDKSDKSEAYNLLVRPELENLSSFMDRIVEQLDEKLGVTTASQSGAIDGRDDPKNEILQLELEFLDTPEKLRDCGSPSVESQRTREVTIIKTKRDTETIQSQSATIKADKVLTPKQEVLWDKIVENFNKDKEVKLFEDGKFLGMKARLGKTTVLETREVLMIEMSLSEDDDFPFTMFVETIRGEDKKLRAVNMDFAFIPVEFIEDFSQFLTELAAS